MAQKYSRLPCRTLDRRPPPLHSIPIGKVVVIIVIAAVCEFFPDRTILNALCTFADCFPEGFNSFEKSFQGYGIHSGMPLAKVKFLTRVLIPFIDPKKKSIFFFFFQKFEYFLLFFQSLLVVSRKKSLPRILHRYDSSGRKT